MSDRPLSVRGPWAFIQAFLLGGALMALWQMPQWSWNGEVRIEGAAHLDPTTLIKEALGHEGKPLYRIDPATIRDRLLALPSVRNVKVRRWLFPARIEITLRERTPLARVLGTPEPLFLDDEGVIFTLPHGETADVPLSCELATNSLGLTERANLKYLLAAWPPGSKGVVDMRDPARWRATLDGVEVLLGTSDNLSEKFRVYRHLIPLAHQAGKAIQYVDLRFPEAPTVRTSEVIR